MSNPRAPARERFYGPMYGDPLAQSVPHLVGENPDTLACMKRTYGRYLAGFGGESMSGQVGYDPRYQGQEIYDLEGEDDTFGSGIFDPSGRGGTSNADMGVFASHDSLPGYIARNVPFTVSRDVTDITDDADVVSVPGGGMAYVERHGRLSGAAITGPTWRPTQIEPAGWTRHDQVYVSMSPEGDAGTYLNEGAPERAPAPLLRPESVQRSVYEVEGVPLERQVQTWPQYQRVPTRSIADARQYPVPVAPASQPVSRQAPDLPAGPQVPLRQIVNVAPAGRPIPVSGYGAYGHRATPGGVFGQVQQCPEGQSMDIDTGECVPSVLPEEDKKPPSTVQLAIYGLLAGAAVGLVVGLVRKKG